LPGDRIARAHLRAVASGAGGAAWKRRNPPRGTREAAEAEDAEGESEKRKRKGDGVVLFNFGDSNSDTGGVAAVMGIRIAPPEERACFHHLTGWLCDDSVTLDFICM